MPVYPEPQWDTIYGEIKKDEQLDVEEGVEPIPDVYMITMEVDDQFGDNYYVRKWVNHNDDPDYWEYVLTDVYCELREKFA